MNHMPLISWNQSYLIHSFTRNLLLHIPQFMYLKNFSFIETDKRMWLLPLVPPSHLSLFPLTFPLLVICIWRSVVHLSVRETWFVPLVWWMEICLKWIHSASPVRPTLYYPLTGSTYLSWLRLMKSTASRVILYFYYFFFSQMDGDIVTSHVSHCLYFILFLETQRSQFMQQTSYSERLIRIMSTFLISKPIFVYPSFPFSLSLSLF